MNFLPMKFFPKENGNKYIKHKAIMSGMITEPNCPEALENHHLKIQKKKNKKIIQRINKTSKY